MHSWLYKYFAKTSKFMRCFAWTTRSADWESCHTEDPSDWKLLPLLLFHYYILYKTLMEFYHTCNVDLFANRHNAQLKRYWSWKPEPLAEGTDAFSQIGHKWRVICFLNFVWWGNVSNELYNNVRQSS